ncbi:hypothetical protein ACE4N1_002006 [Campylobacter coli]
MYEKPRRKSTVTLEEAKELYPEWYEKRIVQGEPKQKSREPYRGRGQPFQPGRCERRYKEAKDDLFLWYFEILEKNEIKIYPKKMTYNQMMEECKKNDIYIIKPLYSLGYTYNNNREDFKNYN